MKQQKYWRYGRSAVVYFWLVALLPDKSDAMTFAVHGNNSHTLNAVLATGTIDWNDAEKLNQFLARQSNKHQTAIYLDSPGGSLEGGIRLGEYFKRNRIKTIVEGNKTCASACALAFLGGTDKYGNRWMSTTTSSGLGFHAFRNADGNPNGDTDETQQIVGKVLEYGQLVQAPMEIFVRNFKTPSDKIYWFSTDEALSLGIKVWDMENKSYVGKSRQATQNPDLPNAAEFISTYFSKIKKVPYQQTWDMLSGPLKDQGFNAYVDWWDKRVKAVSLRNVQELSSNSVQAELSYAMQNGKNLCTINTFILQNNSDSWLIIEQQSRRCKE